MFFIIYLSDINEVDCSDGDIRLVNGQTELEGTQLCYIHSK